MGFKNGDVSGVHCYTNSQILSEANNHKFIYFTKKSNENTHNISYMKNTGLQAGVYIDVMLTASTLHQDGNVK